MLAYAEYADVRAGDALSRRAAGGGAEDATGAVAGPAEAPPAVRAALAPALAPGRALLRLPDTVFSTSMAATELPGWAWSVVAGADERALRL